MKEKSASSSSTHRHRVLQALPEVVHRQRQAHRQHQEAQRVGEQVRLEPRERGRLGDAQRGAGADPDGEERRERLRDVLEGGALAGDGEIARGRRGDDGAGVVVVWCGGSAEKGEGGRMRMERRRRSRVSEQGRRKKEKGQRRGEIEARRCFSSDRLPRPVRPCAPFGMPIQSTGHVRHIEMPVPEGEQGGEKQGATLRRGGGKKCKEQKNRSSRSGRLLLDEPFSSLSSPTSLSSLFSRFR